MAMNKKPKSQKDKKIKMTQIWNKVWHKKWHKYDTKYTTKYDTNMTQIWHKVWHKYDIEYDTNGTKIWIIDEKNMAQLLNKDDTKLVGR